MVAVEAIDRQVVLYRSDDLLTWEFLSSFGPAVPSAVNGNAGPVSAPCRRHRRDALGVARQPQPGRHRRRVGNAVLRRRFRWAHLYPARWHAARKADDVPGLHALNWLDFGHDCYAGSHSPDSTTTPRTLIAWMSNWDYARHMPFDADTPQRGRMTLPRRLSLVKVDGQLRVRKRPSGPPAGRAPRSSTEPVVVQPIRCMPDRPGRQAGRTAGFDVEFAGDNDSRVTSLNCADQELTLDRQAAAHGFRRVRRHRPAPGHPCRPPCPTIRRWCP